MTASVQHEDTRSEPARTGDRFAALREAVGHAAHVLPSQGPIEIFVHHNTLHAFEHLPFDEAVQKGQDRYGAQPYFSEAAYREMIGTGRITISDLQAVLQDEVADHDVDLIDGLGRRVEIQLAMLRHPLLDGTAAERHWIAAETDAFDRLRSDVPARVRENLLAGSKQWLTDSIAGTSTINHASDDLVKSLLKKFGRHFDHWSDETWERFTLHLLWKACRQGVTNTASVPRQTRSFLSPRDLLFQATGEDINRYVHDVLIRFCGVFLDQGYADWPLPDRDQGLYHAFLSLYSQPHHGPNLWMLGLSKELRSLKHEQTSAEESIDESLDLLGIAEKDREEFITETLLRLRGWAGMVRQMEVTGQQAVRPVPQRTLIEFLAIRLLLERRAIAHVGRESLGKSGSIRSILEQATAQIVQPETLSLERRAFLLFQVAQIRGWQPSRLLRLSPSEWSQLVTEIEGFSSIERRRVFHESFERKYRVAALDAFGNHARRCRDLSACMADSGDTSGATASVKRPSFQIVCCIDDREESFLRHLEEIAPDCETFGAAGFFAVVMNYKGAADSFYKALCPIVVVPNHFVQEDVGYTFEGVHRSRAQMRHRLGRATYLFHTRSRTFLGGIIAGITGSLATAPLVARVLFPHLTSRIRERFGSLLQPPPVTRLQLERFKASPGPDNGHIGFTTEEMADIVTRLLQDIGLTKTESFSRLFVVCGHGSSSLNNPHESAYCCGACAGKRGGPNARAFAEMANDWRIRTMVAERGIEIPEDTRFVGAYHNTCDDSLVFYDLDRLSASHRADFDRARSVFEEARRRNAHERCRRFASAPLSLTPDEALRHVEARAQDLAQVRPEYNHATNALCIVGRRDWTRGLFLDRRAFLTSYDPTQDDDDHSILMRILSAAVPVCAGINLEYYFSCVDPVTFGAGSKLPHNLVSMLGVMEGAASDLRTGLYQQMVEIHEPVRLLFVVETSPAAMLSIMERNETIARLCRGGWVQMAVIDPALSIDGSNDNDREPQLYLFRNGQFELHELSTLELPQRATSRECYQGNRDHLPFFSIGERKHDSE